MLHRKLHDSTATMLSERCQPVCGAVDTISCPSPPGLRRSQLRGACMRADLMRGQREEVGGPIAPVLSSKGW